MFGPDQSLFYKLFSEREVWAQGIDTYQGRREGWIFEPLFFSLEINALPSLMKDPQVDTSEVLSACCK